jgi:hypothetical protein
MTTNGANKVSSVSVNIAQEKNDYDQFMKILINLIEKQKKTNCLPKVEWSDAIHLLTANKMTRPMKTALQCTFFEDWITTVPWMTEKDRKEAIFFHKNSNSAYPSSTALNAQELFNNEQKLSKEQLKEIFVTLVAEDIEKTYNPDKLTYINSKEKLEAIEKRYGKYQPVEKDCSSVNSSDSDSNLWPSESMKAVYKDRGSSSEGHFDLEDHLSTDALQTSRQLERVHCELYEQHEEVNHAPWYAPNSPQYTAREIALSIYKHLLEQDNQKTK